MEKYVEWESLFASVPSYPNQIPWHRASTVDNNVTIADSEHSIHLIKEGTHFFSYHWRGLLFCPQSFFYSWSVFFRPQVYSDSNLWIVLNIWKVCSTVLLCLLWHRRLQNMLTLLYIISHLHSFTGLQEDLRHITNDPICFDYFSVVREKQTANKPDNHLSPNHVFVVRCPGSWISSSFFQPTKLPFGIVPLQSDKEART